MLAPGVVELYLSNDLFLLLLFSWGIVIQLALIINPKGPDRIKLSKHVKFPVKIGRCLVTSGCFGHFEWRFVDVEVCRIVGFAVEDEFVELGTDVAEGCFLVHFVKEAVAKNVAVVGNIIIAVHNLASFRHILIVILRPLSIVFHRRKL